MQLRSLCVLVAALALAGAAHAQNLVANPDFETDVAGWSPGNEQISVAWSPLDPLDPVPSGSLQVTSVIANGATSGAIQCVALGGASAVDLHVLALVPEDPALEYLTARAYVYYYGSPDCADELGGEFATDFVSEGEGWAPIEHRFSHPGAQSVLLLLGVNKPHVATPGTAYFDQVVLPEPGASLQGACVLAALAILARGRRSAHVD